VSSDILLRSQPIRKGDLRAAHSTKYASYSLGFMPPLPTSSMSGSFQWLGVLLEPQLFVQDRHEGVPVVGDVAVGPPGVAHGDAQVAGLSTPHSHIDKKMRLPVLLRASRMGGYRTFGEVPSVLQLLYLR
jgi:hypothetical protein